MEELPPELKPKPDNYFYKKHSDHAGFKAPPTMETEPDAVPEAPKAWSGSGNDGVLYS
jgi:hypothetical protein